MRYEAPESEETAVSLLAGADGPAHVLAGGTDLLVRMRSGVTEPALVLDIKRIAGMREIRREDGAWVIGAGVASAEVCEHADVAAAFPGVVEALGLIGSTQIQGRATPAGNLCNASPAADSVPAMAAVGAKARIVGASGRRELPVEAVPVAPGRTALAADEFVSAIVLPDPAPRTVDAYLRFIPRTEMDIAVVGCGVSVSLDEAGLCTAARVSLGAVAPTVIMVPEAAALVGTAIDDAALAALAAACSAAARPIDDKRGTVAFRKRVAGVLASRAAGIARDRAKDRAKG
ncbi:MAG: xanthine dehydrogenase family protein subunit M [Pseudomonadota bacterium]